MFASFEFLFACFMVLFACLQCFFAGFMFLFTCFQCLLVHFMFLFACFHVVVCMSHMFLCMISCCLEAGCTFSKLMIMICINKIFVFVTK